MRKTDPEFGIGTRFGRPGALPGSRAQGAGCPPLKRAHEDRMVRSWIPNPAATKFDSLILSVHLKLPGKRARKPRPGIRGRSAVGVVDRH